VASNTKVVQAFYDEIATYNFANPNSSTGVTGHLTALLWEDSETLGCGWAGEQEGGYYVVCRYSPPGNWRGEQNYIDNVFCPI
jgi:hypothetical protein